jgi:hypothetical protein
MEEGRRRFCGTDKEEEKEKEEEEKEKEEDGRRKGELRAVVVSLVMRAVLLASTTGLC